jgi:cyclohexanone monooxygenase
MFGTFYDVATDADVNEMAAAFIRKKIRSVVEDEETARTLAPTGLYAKRPVCDMGYYETFNRSNVTLVDLNKSPIISFTRDGIRTASGDHEIDIVIFATGFEAVDGNYIRLDIRGRDGLTIKDRWRDGSSAYLGMATAGFPNMFMVLGSHSAFANLPPVIEAQVEFIADLIDDAKFRKAGSVEASRDAEDDWVRTCIDIADRTLFTKMPSWIFGANIPGKPHTVMFYMNGLANFRQKLSNVVMHGYDGFLFNKLPLEKPSAADPELAKTES